MLYIVFYESFIIFKCWIQIRWVSLCNLWDKFAILENNMIAKICIFKTAE